MENKQFVIRYIFGSKREEQAILLTAIDANAARVKARPILAIARPSAVVTNAYQVEYAIVPYKNLEVPAVAVMTENTEPQEPQQYDIGPDELA
jgi:hypothetical protein